MTQKYYHSHQYVAAAVRDSTRHVNVGWDWLLSATTINMHCTVMSTQCVNV